MESLIPATGPLNGAELIYQHYAWPVSDKPWVRMNFVASVDGGAWGHNKLSASISTPADRQVFGVLRATSDAILVGAGTALAENYGSPASGDKQRELRARLYKPEPPVLAVVSGSGNVPSDAKMFENPTNQPEIYSSEVKAVEALGEAGQKRILCEGGPHLFASLLSSGLVDEVCLTLAPLLVGPASGSDQISRIVAGSAHLPDNIPLELTRLAVADDSTLLGMWKVNK